MPSYDPRRIEPKWQRYWREHKTFRAIDFADKPKLYVLDMFPYPSGEGLHVGHPEGYTATDILCRYRRMRGFNVLHPMGWDAFGLPAEQYAIETGTHPRVTTQRNIDTFRRQIQALGFSYDWDREINTTDPAYYKWTQWIFLQIYDTWYDPDYAWIDSTGRSRRGKGRPIAELPIPPGVESAAAYRDAHRLAYRAEVPVNWCPALGTVLANEEVAGGVSERGGHPVVRIPLRQWMLRITAYAERLLDDLELVDWPEPIKEMQRNWIGRSEGAEVDFYIGADPEGWMTARAGQGWPAAAPVDCLRVFTTRPDTLFGATYMVLAPEHSAVERLTTPEQRPAVDAYRAQAAAKSDLDRTDLARQKTGVFTGSYAVNPVNGRRVPIWIADYVLATYGTGAIMAVPAHDERDFEFAQAFGLPIRVVVEPPDEWLIEVTRPLTTGLGNQPAGWSAWTSGLIAWWQAAMIRQLTEPAIRDLKAFYNRNPQAFPQAFCGAGVGVNSTGPDVSLDGLATDQAKRTIAAWLERRGLGRPTIHYKLRDWLFSRQRYWGEPFPVLIGPDDSVQPVAASDLPVVLPELEDFRPSGKPEPPLSKATDWVNRVVETGSDPSVQAGGAAGDRSPADQHRDGAAPPPGRTGIRRETNTMPQWAGSCWYYLRYLDPRNTEQPWDPAKERYWMPVDLYVGGAEHAVLHLLYARFWHKVLFDRGHVSTAEPFRRLVNQGMILGEMEFTAFRAPDGRWVSAGTPEAEAAEPVRIDADRVEKRGDHFVLADAPDVRLDARSFKMSKSRGNVINPDQIVADYGADALRLYEMFMGPLEATKPWSTKGVEGIFRFLGRVWRMVIQERAADVVLDPAIQDVEPSTDQLRVLHRTIQAVTADLEGMRFNTAISRMMEFVNQLTPQSVRPRRVIEPFVLLLAPFAPHLAEELWAALGHPESLAYDLWPEYDEAMIREAEIELVVQVNGKLRGRLKVPADATDADLERFARGAEHVSGFLKGKTIARVIVVPKKLVNIVVR